jgi:hypothetical protein
MSPSPQLAASDRLLVQIASYNTNLQGFVGLPQDLVDWLSPTLHVSGFLTKQDRAPDIVAVGFQELLPLHLGRAFVCLTFVLTWHYRHSTEMQLLDDRRRSLMPKTNTSGLRSNSTRRTKRHIPW